MTTLTLKLSEEKIKLLEKNARKSGKTVEEYICSNAAKEN